MSLWSIRKAIVALNKIVHLEFLPSFSEEDVAKFDDERCSKKDVIDFLKYIYEHSNHLALYGNEEEMFDDFEMLDEISQFLKFSEFKELEMMTGFFVLTTNKCYNHPTEEIKFISKSDFAIEIHKRVVDHLNNISADDNISFNGISFVMTMFWLNAQTNKHLRELKGSYDLIELELLDPLISKLDDICHRDLIQCDSSIPTTYENFKQYFDLEEKPFFDKAFGPQSIARNKILENIPKKGVDLMERIKGLFDEYAEVFTPFSKLPSSCLQKPCIRYFPGYMSEYFQAKEVHNAINFILKWRVSNSTISLPLETEEERKIGIVNTISPCEMEKIIDQLGDSATQLIILSCPTKIDVFESIFVGQLSNKDRCFFFFFFSSYGTYCVPSTIAFNKILFYLSVVLRIFQRSNAENLKKVYDWIDDLMDTVFQPKPMVYLIETWKIDEIIDRARDELSQYLTEPEYQINYKKGYTINEVTQEINNLLNNLKIDMRLSYQPAIIEQESFSLVDIGFTYTKRLRLHLLEKSEKFQNFWKSQESAMKADNKKVMKRVLQKSDNVKKESENQEEQLKQFVDRFLERSKEKLLKAENNLKTHLEASSSQIAKLEEELHKTKKHKNQLAEKLEIIERKKSKEMDRLQKDNENLKKEMSEIKHEMSKKVEELERKNVKNTEFQRKIKDDNATCQRSERSNQNFGSNTG